MQTPSIVQVRGTDPEVSRFAKYTGTITWTGETCEAILESARAALNDYESAQCP